MVSARFSLERLVQHLPISVTWCDVTQFYSFKVIPVHCYACYLDDILCASAIVKTCNIELYVLFLFVPETWFLILRLEYILRAFNNSVRSKLNSNGEEVMERWTELHNSQFHIFTQ